ncbi:MAG: carbohydrate ABC transporter permease [Nitrososphaeria archaeon]
MKDAKGVMTYIVLLILAVIWLSPCYMELIAALKTNEEFATSPWWVFPINPLNSLVRNIETALKEAHLGNYIINSFLYAAIGSVSAALVASLAAFPIARMSFRGRDTIFYIIMLGTFFPYQMYIIPLLRLWVSLGLYDTFFGLQIVYIAVCMPFLVFLLRNYFITIPKDIEDAAIVDGVGYFGLYYKIFMPLASPALITGICIQFVWIWNDLLFGMILTSSLNTRNIMTGLASLVGGFRYTYSTQAAAALLAAIPPMAFFLTLQKFVIKGLLLGAVKK